MSQQGQAFSKCSWLNESFIPSLENEYPEAYNLFESELKVEKQKGNQSKFWSEPKPQPTISKQLFKRAFEDALDEMTDQMKLSKARSILNKAIKKRLEMKENVPIVRVPISNVEAEPSKAEMKSVKRGKESVKRRTESVKRSENISNLKVKGVSLHPRRNKYQSEISSNRKRVHLGYYDHLEDAALAYNIASLIVHGDDRRLNNARFKPNERSRFDNLYTGIRGKFDTTGIRADNLFKSLIE